MTIQRAYFFDMDGVLFDSMPRHAIAWEEVMKQHGLPFTAYDCYINEGRTGESVIREAFQKALGRDATHEEVKTILNNMQEEAKVNAEATLATLRHDITYAYEKYKKTKKLPGNTKNDVCSLYEIYVKMGGNSYVHEIFEEMMKWDTE